MGQLEIIGESESVRASDITKRFKVVHGESVTLDPSSTDEFRQNVESDFHSGDTVNDTTRNHGDCAHDDTIHHDGRGGMRGPQSDPQASDEDRCTKHSKVPELRDFRVRFHQSVVNVLVNTRLTLAFTTKCVFESHDDFVTVVEKSIADETRVDCKEPKVIIEVGRGHVSLRILGIVLRRVERVIVNDSRDIV